MAKKKRTSKKPAKKLASVSSSANAGNPRESKGSADIHRFALASVAAQLNRAAVKQDGALPRRELDVSRSTTKRTKPCTLEEAVNDTRSHLDDGFLHEDWQPFEVDYDGENATVTMQVPLSAVVDQLEQLLESHAETPSGAEPGALPDGIAERSPLAAIMHALPKSLQARMQAHAGVYLTVPWPLAKGKEQVPHRDFEQHLQAVLSHDPHLPYDKLQSVHQVLSSIKPELRAVKEGLRSLFELPSEVRNPGRHFDLWCKPQPYTIQLSEDKQNVSITFPALRDVKALAHRLGYLDHRAVPDLPDPLLDALEHLWQQAEASLDTPIGPVPDESDQSSRHWSDVEALFNDQEALQDDDRRRVAHLVRTYASLHHKSLCLKHALEAMVTLKSFVSTRGDLLDPEGEQTPLLGGDDKADKADTASGPPDAATLAKLDDEGLRGEFRRVMVCLQRDTHLVAHLKHIVSSSMMACDNLLLQVKEYQEKSINALQSRRKQRLDVEQRIWKAGSRANQKSVDRARVQILSMERDEQRQQAEIDDHDDYANKLKACKRWIMDDIALLTPLEKKYDEKLIPKAQGVVGTEGRLPSLSSPVRATAVKPTPEALAECDKAIQQLVDYTELVSQRMVAASLEFRNTQSSYLDRIVENVDARNPLAQAIAKAAMGRLIRWREAAVRLSQDQSAKTAAERQHNFEQLIGTLDAQTKAKADVKDKRKELVDEPLQRAVSMEESTPPTPTVVDNDDMPTARDGVSTVIAMSLNPDQIAVQAALEEGDDGEDWQEASVVRKKKVKAKDRRPGTGKNDKHDKYDKKKLRKEKRRNDGPGNGKAVRASNANADPTSTAQTVTTASSGSTPPSTAKAAKRQDKQPLASDSQPPTTADAPTPAEAMQSSVVAQSVRQLEFAPDTKPQTQAAPEPSPTNPPRQAEAAAPGQQPPHASVANVPTTAPPEDSLDASPSPAVAVVFRKRHQQATGEAPATFSFANPSNPTTPVQTEPTSRLPEPPSLQETARQQEPGLPQPPPTFSAVQDKNRTDPTENAPSDLNPNKGVGVEAVPQEPMTQAAPFPHTAINSQVFRPTPQPYMYPPPYGPEGSFPVDFQQQPFYGPGFQPPPPDPNFPLDYPMNGDNPPSFYPMQPMMPFDGAVAPLPNGVGNPYMMDMMMQMQYFNPYGASGFLPSDMAMQGSIPPPNSGRGKGKRGGRGGQGKNRRHSGRGGHGRPTGNGVAGRGSAPATQAPGQKAAPHNT
eukprot:m.223246 g.223246  ORF g.223246 m.223246 type:complete len:1239 (-) comp17266_c0_seq2:141-3857(-)